MTMGQAFGESLASWMTNVELEHFSLTIIIQVQEIENSLAKNWLQRACYQKKNNRFDMIKQR
jgi:hypothetical protein